ncbi:hypothetical protein CALVIDRAFT_333334 [Calocera viscosa TUFC12733]|uniref:Uncharacterized protein n=1 Tax=Calocera viscosa (strain TUFC12733) TaxID=1330018 RepID=A0A167HQQ0_CALVF|nr:hypothetical protein CALVIDRAFT_333334 [Calocera viscosa TUFC12733]
MITYSSLANHRRFQGRAKPCLGRHRRNGPWNVLSFTRNEDDSDNVAARRPPAWSTLLLWESLKSSSQICMISSGPLQAVGNSVVLMPRLCVLFDLPRLGTAECPLPSGRNAGRTLRPFPPYGLLFQGDAISVRPARQWCAASFKIVPRISTP